jgi:choline transport protein
MTQIQAVCLLTFVVNIYGIRHLPAFQLMGGICHVMLFLVLIVPLILLAPRSTPEFVFTEFMNEGGWSNGISWCVGLLSVTFPFMGKQCLNELENTHHLSIP